MLTLVAAMLLGAPPADYSHVRPMVVPWDARRKSPGRPGGYTEVTIYHDGTAVACFYTYVHLAENLEKTLKQITRKDLRKGTFEHIDEQEMLLCLSTLGDALSYDWDREANKEKQKYRPAFWLYRPVDPFMLRVHKAAVQIQEVKHAMFVRRELQRVEAEQQEAQEAK